MRRRRSGLEKGIRACVDRPTHGRRRRHPCRVMVAWLP